jgi:hypothetical protein
MIQTQSQNVEIRQNDDKAWHKVKYYVRDEVRWKVTDEFWGEAWWKVRYKAWGKLHL